MDIAILVFAIFTFMNVVAANYHIEKVEKRLNETEVCTTAMKGCAEALKGCQQAQDSCSEKGLEEPEKTHDL